MEKILKSRGILLVWCLLLLAGCEKTGYYTEVEQGVIDNLTDKNWEREYHVKLDNGEEFDVHERWIFYDTAKGSCKSVTTYKDGETKETQTYFNWSFTTPNFGIIYLDYGLYWEIKELTALKLHIYETYYDPVTNPGQTYRDFQMFEAVANRK